MSYAQRLRPDQVRRLSTLTPEVRTAYHEMLLTSLERDDVFARVFMNRAEAWEQEEQHGIGDLPGRRRRLDDALEVMAQTPQCDLTQGGMGPHLPRGGDGRG